VIVLAGAATAGTNGPRTLVTSKRPIWEVAQSSSALAWIDDYGRVRMERFAGGKPATIGTAPPDPSGPLAIAVAGTRALWAYDDGGNDYDTAISAGGLGLEASNVAGLTGGERSFGDGERFSGLGRDATTLAYGWVDETCATPTGICDFCQPLGSCPLVVTGGGVAVVTPGVKPAVIPAVTPPALFALAQGRVAVAPARSPAKGGFVPRVVEDGPVQVFDDSGRLLATVPLAGLVRGLAMDGHRLAVVDEEPDGSRVILVVDARTGTMIGGGGRVSPAAASVSIAGGRIVFRVGNGIYLLRGERPALLLARAASTPIGPSLVGKRVVWAENPGRHGRIRSLTLR
jgi:hypothetical protein